jgi:hypothetical protein
MERHTARYVSFDSIEDGLRWGQERPQATEPRFGANQQVKGHVRVCVPFSQLVCRRAPPLPRLPGRDSPSHWPLTAAVAV